MFMLPPNLNSPLNLQTALAQIQTMLRTIHDAADTVAPEATPELWNAIESLNGALRDLAPYAEAEHAAWLKAEYERQQKF